MGFEGNKGNQRASREVIEEIRDDEGKEIEYEYLLSLIEGKRGKE